MGDEFIRINDPAAIFDELNLKFTQNLNKSLSSEYDLFCQTEKLVRSFAQSGEQIRQLHAKTAAQLEISHIFSEIFADSVCSIYLSSIGLDRPAEAILRRAFEQGVAAVYLWDLPHAYYGWKDLDKDLSFSEMLTHLDSTPFRAYLKSMCPERTVENVLDVQSFQQIYRYLSNTIHGKFSTLESTLPSRYSHSPQDWKRHLELVIAVTTLLKSLWHARWSFNDIQPGHE